jgi:hypothetical protein
MGAKAGVQLRSWAPAFAGMHGVAALFVMIMLPPTPCS